MNKRLLLACLALAVHYVPHQARAQFTDAHSYDNTPVGINQLELSYAYVHSDTSIDTSLVITGAKLNLNQGTIGYTRYFGVLHRLMWAEASVPVGGLAGSISGTPVQGSITGAGDSSYQVAMLLKGGRALSVTQFEDPTPLCLFLLKHGLIALPHRLLSPRESFRFSSGLGPGDFPSCQKPRIVLGIS